MPTSDDDDDDEPIDATWSPGDPARIEFAATTKIDLFQPQVDRVLTALGIDPDDEAVFVSDDSEMQFFGLDADEHARVEQELGITFEVTDALWEVARRLRDAERLKPPSR